MNNPTNTSSIGNSGTAKHEKYKQLYKTNELYFGIGVENEIYIEFKNGIEFTAEKFLTNRRRERYSVDYNNTYDQSILTDVLKEYIDNNKRSDNKIKLPLMMGSHSFIHTDIKNNPRTMYTKLVEPNPKFLGKTLHTVIMESDNQYLKNSYDKNWVYDGDTVEFITTNFYKVTTDVVVKELEEIRKTFMENLNKLFKEKNIFQNYGEMSVMKNNYPFVVFLTNIYNNNMFNNGTLHFNVTLPTFLNESGNISDVTNFVIQHKYYAKYIQYIEPLFIAMFGSPDIFATFGEKANLFSKGSQRCAVSRYISVGSYDVNKMISGKLLSEPVDMIGPYKNDHWWYNKFHEKSGYVKFDKLGYDINFNKHYNHGLEIRIFEHIDDINLIKEILDFFVYLGDFILDEDNEDIISESPNPIYNKTWNSLTENIIRYGKNGEVTAKQKSLYSYIFSTIFTANTAGDLYIEIRDYLKNKYNGNGIFSCMAINQSVSNPTQFK
jgi:hypothetical protein